MAASLVALISATSIAFAGEGIEYAINDVADFFSPVASDDKTSPHEEPGESEILETGVIEQTQMLVPQNRPSLRVAQQRRRSSAAAPDSDLASVPFMIGDTGAGTCLSFSGLVDVDLSHPTLTCSRLNISENNTPLPTDRLYASFRHFHNGTNFRYFQFERDYRIDRVTLAGEKTFFDRMMSFEVRLPIENRLSSDVQSYDVFNPPLFLPDPPFARDSTPFLAASGPN